MKNTHELAHSAFISALIGLAIGTTLELVFSVGMGYDYSPGVPAFLSQFESPMVAILITRALYMVLGLICGLSCAIYNNERLSLLAASLIHIVICAAGFLLIGYILKWGISAGVIACFLIVYAAIYIVLWIVNYLKIQRLNKTL